jgi:glutathione S-transferase
MRSCNLSILVSILSISTSAAFAGSRGSINSINTNINTNTHTHKRTPRVRFFGRPASSSLSVATTEVVSIDDSTTATTTTTTSNKWEDLQKAIAPSDDEQEPVKEPVLTFYRDTNGWCPFCLRVWVCIRAKNLPYQERLIPLQNKPDWYKDMVPTAQTPALLFHHSGDFDGDGDGAGDGDAVSNKSRKLVWDSLDIMKALDDMFPDTRQLVLDTVEYKQASEMNAQLNKVGFAFTYASRPSTEAGAPELTPSEKKQAFLDQLDVLEQALALQQNSSNGNGPFRLGKEFTGVDAEMIPSLERWRYQLPLSKDVDILEGRPALKIWFEAMEAFEPFGERASGDEYSWIATNVQFARIFGKEGDADTMAQIEKSESAAFKLVDGFRDAFAVKDDECEGRFALEAAAKVISNHAGIAKDCTNGDPKSQKNISRAASVETAEKMLLVVARILLKGDDAVKEARSITKASLLEDMGFVVGDGDDERLDAANAAKTVATRLCAPRDMSAPAAKILRAVLMIVAEKLEE